MKRATRFIVYIILCLCISIHALVKRATDWEANFPDLYDISIHALVKRATSLLKSQVVFPWISIHALVKRATGTASSASISDRISIHALVKRATPFSVTGKQRYPNFNPRPREEGDNIFKILYVV